MPGSFGIFKRFHYISLHQRAPSLSVAVILIFDICILTGSNKGLGSNLKWLPQSLTFIAAILVDDVGDTGMPRQFLEHTDQSRPGLVHIAW